jgi:predicted DNA-binding transcriptional regulator AlpA
MPVAIDNPLNQPVYLKSSTIKARFGWSDMTLWRRMRDAALPFPQPITLGGPRLWREHEVAAWEIAKAAVDAGKSKAIPPQVRRPTHGTKGETAR